MSSSEKKVVRTVCGMCNRQSCGMEVTVEDGKVIDIQRNPEYPKHHGTLCVKGYAAKELLYDPHRLKHPMKREGDAWTNISWDEAMSTIAGKLKETKEKYGAESLAVYTGCEQLGETSYFVRRFMNVYGSPNVVTVGSMCSVMRNVVDQLTFGGNFRQVDTYNTKLIIMWGANPAASNAPYYMDVKTLTEAKDRGAKLVVIDPVLSGTASVADSHVRIRPGTDGALALGMINIIVKQGLYDREFVDNWCVGFSELSKLVEEYTPEKVEQITWIPAEVVKDLARKYATAKPACIMLGNALEQHTNSFQMLRAIAALRAVTGNIDVPGGNINISEGAVSLTDISLREMMPTYRRPLGWRDYLLFSLFAGPPLVSFMRALLTDDPYPIKTMLVTWGNPLLTWPDSAKVGAGLERLDFLAVMDFHMTKTAELADIVLPAATFLERTGLHATAQFLAPDKPVGFISLANKAVNPLYESWPDWKFWFELAKRMGYEKWFPWEDIEEALDYQLKPTGYTVEKLKDKTGFFHGEVPKFRKYLTEGFKTSTGKVELYSIALRNLGYDPLPRYSEPEESPYSTPEKAKEYPLVLIAGSRLLAYPHSGMRTLPSLQKVAPDPEVIIHPDTAERYSVKNGESILVETERGSAQFKASVTDRIMPEVASITHGWTQANANLLVSSEIRDRMFGAPAMRSMLCKIRKSAG